MTKPKIHIFADEYCYEVSLKSAHLLLKNSVDKKLQITHTLCVSVCVCVCVCGVGGGGGGKEKKRGGELK